MIKIMALSYQTFYTAQLLETKLNICALFTHLILTVPYKVWSFILKKRNEAQRI